MLVAQWTFTGGLAMDTAAALDALRDDPDYFLKYYPICIAGANVPHVAGTANVLGFKMHKYGGDPDLVALEKAGHWGATRPGKGLLGSLTMEISSFMIDRLIQSPWPGTVFDAYSVPQFVVDTIDIRSMNHYLLGDNGPDIMVTGQFSGCTFAWLQVGNAIAAIHVKPITNTYGGFVQDDINMHGRFTAYPWTQLQTFGRNDYATVTHATVIGVRVNGTWNLYAQYSNDRCRTITAAYRLYPGPMTRL